MKKSDSSPDQYAESDAQKYASFNVSGSTYEIGYRCIGQLLRGLGKQSCVLDFGCGSGRFTALASLVTPELTLCVDRNFAMLQSLSASGTADCVAICASIPLPLGNSCIDLIICSSVLIEIHKFEELVHVMSEFRRVLRPGGTILIMTTHPEARGKKYFSFDYSSAANPKSSDGLDQCKIESVLGQLLVYDKIWTESQYRTAFQAAGLLCVETHAPLALERDSNLTTERACPPFMIFKLTNL